MAAVEDDAYSECVGGSLKLKRTADGGVKKKKKKKRAKEALETVEKVEEKERLKEEAAEKPKDIRTAAQKAYDKVQEKRQAERILKKAKKTHKQRVEELNKYMDTLSEHYDIPKVSWTK